MTWIVFLFLLFLIVFYFLACLYGVFTAACALQDCCFEDAPFRVKLMWLAVLAACCTGVIAPLFARDYNNNNIQVEITDEVRLD